MGVYTAFLLNIMNEIKLQDTSFLQQNMPTETGWMPKVNGTVICLNNWLTLCISIPVDLLTSDLESEYENQRPLNLKKSRLWRDITGGFHLNKWRADELILGQRVSSDTVETIFS